MSTDNIKEIVKEKYGEAALRAGAGGSSCCGASPATSRNCCDPITSNLYDAEQAGQIPEEAMLASLGCGNPTTLAKLNPGETVLDLGSGGGVDVGFATNAKLERALGLADGTIVSLRRLDLMRAGIQITGQHQLQS